MSEQDLIAVCHSPFDHIEIHSDGKVYPCCPDYCKYTCFGNIFEESDFEKIWNSDTAIKFRTSLLNKDYSVCNLGCCNFNWKEKIETPSNYLTKMQTYPKYVKFCHEKQCNVRCITCRDKQQYTSKEQTEKLNSLIEPLFLPILKDCKVVVLNGEGEIFASKHCRTLVKAIVQKYPDIKFGIHSNGLCFDKKNCDDLGITDRIEYAEVSIHAATKKTYDKIVRDSNFDKVMKNVKWLADLKKHGKINFIQLDFVISSINYKEMKAFQSFANKLNLNTRFTAYRPWGSAELDKQFTNVAIFNKTHPKYNKFVKILQDDIFKTPNCRMQNALKNLKPVSRSISLKYKSNIDDKSLLFLFKLRDLYNMLLFYKLDKSLFDNENEQEYNHKKKKYLKSKLKNFKKT
jgi:radical SAM protein with 4Fe4S-binding SPASM domain